MSCRYCGGEECHTHHEGIVVYHVESACPEVQASCRELLRLQKEDKPERTYSPVKWLKDLLCG
jgi:hypothetical protein